MGQWKKTKIVSQTRKWTPAEQNVIIGVYNLEDVDSFTYLGNKLSKDV